MASRITDDDTFRRLGRARDFLAAGYTERVTLERAALECLSPFHFQRLFTRTFGQSPQDFLTRRRMDTAKDLLAAGDLPVTKVCLEVGIAASGHSANRFAALFGHSPTEYRRQVRRWVAPVNGWPIYRVPSCYFDFWLHGVRKPQD